MIGYKSRKTREAYCFIRYILSTIFGNVVIYRNCIDSFMSSLLVYSTNTVFSVTLII